MAVKRKVLITGGCGFIGRNLVNGFADQGFEVTVADINPQPYRDDVTFLKLDITNRQALIEASRGMDSIIHNASLVQTKNTNPGLLWKVNYEGTINVMDACRANGIKRLVYISSASAVYEGKDIRNGDETLPYSAISQAAYADSKIRAEKELLGMSGADGVNVVALRPHVVFGPEDNRFIPNILEKASSGKLRVEVGRRQKLSDFTYVSNFVDAVLLAEDKLVDGSPVCGQAYFITNGEPLAFFEFVERFMVACGFGKIRGHVPYWLAYGVACIVEGLDYLKGGEASPENGVSRFAVKYMVTDHYYSIDKAKRDLGWAPKVSLDEGIKLTVEHLKKTRHPLLPAP